MQGWAREGLTEEQIAHNMGITRSTLSEWKKKYPDISDTVKKGKEIVDFEVENALLQKALSGDTTAQIFWLKNRKPKIWRDKRGIEVEGNVQTNSPYDELSVDELKALARTCEEDGAH